ncbi:MAG: PAS domain-containing sensor histidine kinase [Candidatus Auribacterota bacterium]|jgi:PAS domain S-box-containing protein|nr:PAS domain-containing sensor histidine kinase [Candidatus Auribacterota bacterium]
MIRPAQDIYHASSVLEFYRKINTCTTAKQALRLFHSVIKNLTDMNELSLYVFDSDNPFIKESFEVSGASGRIRKDVRSYLSPQDIDFIWECKEVDLIEAGRLHFSGKHPENIDYVIPLAVMAQCRGFLILSVFDKDNVDAQIKNTLLQMSGYLAYFLMCVEKSALIEEKNEVISQTREYVSSILENMVHGVISIDNNGEITTFSRGAEILLELNAADVTGHNYRTVFPSQISALIDDIKKNLRTEQYIVESETEYIMQGKYFIPIKFSASLLKDKQGNEAGLLLICKDSSTVKRIIALQELRNMRSEFLATASHEFKTPLNLIMGSAGILADGMVGEMTGQQKHLIKLIQEGGKRLHSLINDLLDMSKIESAESMQAGTVNLADVLRDCLSLHEQAALKKSISIITSVNDPDLCVRAAPESVAKILDNLLSNAIKYTPDGGEVSVSIDVVNTQPLSGQFYSFEQDNISDENENSARIVVSDTGIGISPDDYEVIFDDFKRGSAPYVNQTEGTGLGLAITKRIVKALGGYIAVDSELNRGTSFTVCLPLESARSSVCK